MFKIHKNDSFQYFWNTRNSTPIFQWLGKLWDRTLPRYLVELDLKPSKIGVFKNSVFHEKKRIEKKNELEYVFFFDRNKTKLCASSENRNFQNLYERAYASLL